MKRILTLLFIFISLNITATASVVRPPSKLNLTKSLMTIEEQAKPRISPNTPIPNNKEPETFAYTSQGKGMMWVLGGTFVALTVVLIANIVKASK